MRSHAGRIMVIVAVIWAVVHLAYAGEFIYHDSWKHNFPMLYSFALEGGCSGLPSWLWSPDSGTPSLIYAISQSLTEILRVPALYLLGCFHFGLDTGVYYFKAVIYLSYLALALGMYVFGRLILEERISAVYLFAATLFAGLCLDAAHSDQVFTITFWLPWSAACGVLYHRNYATPIGSRYLNIGIFLVCIQAFDQYPHFQLIVVGAAAVVYAALEREHALAILRIHWRRLCPSALVVAATICQFLVFRQAVGGYAPSLRSGLVIDPATFGETGFLQPSALIGSILPLSFLAGFDALRESMGTFLGYFPPAPEVVKAAEAGIPVVPPHGFIFRLDELALYVGIVPLALALVFLFRPGMARLRLGWALWTATLFAVSLQQTRLYLLLYSYFPFFDVFRSYFLFTLFAMLGILVASAWGFDAILTLSAEERRLTLRRAALALLVLVLGALGALASLALFAPHPLRLLAGLEAPLLADLIMVGVACLALGYAARHGLARPRRAYALIGALLLSQAILTAGTYPKVSITEPQLVAKFGLDDRDRVALDAARRDDPDAVQRKLCTLFAECYLSERPSVSLRRDLDGTFLRSRNAPLFAPGLRMPVVEALSGLTMPVFWPSGRLAEVDSEAELVQRMNAHEADIGRHLRDVVYVRKPVWQALMPNETGGEGWAAAVAMRAQAWGRDAVRLSYEADRPVLMNAAITCTSHWTATVDGMSVPLVCANFDGLLMRLPPGKQTVELRYVDHGGDLVFDTRYMMLAIALLAVAQLCRAILARPKGGRPAAAAGARAEPESGRD